MKNRKRYSCLILSFVFVFALVSVHAQSILPQTQTVATQDTVNSPVNALEMSEINAASMEAFSLFRSVGSEILSKKNRGQLNEMTDSLVVQINTYLSDTVGLNMQRLNLRELESLDNERVLLIQEIEDLNDRISVLLDRAQSNKELLRVNIEPWRLSQEISDPETSPEALLKRINVVIHTSDSISSLVAENIDFLLTSTDKLTGEQIEIEQFGQLIDELGKLHTARVFHRDSDPIWSISSASDTLGFQDRLAEFKANFQDENELIRSKYAPRLILLLLVFLLLMALIYWIKSDINEADISEKGVTLSLYLNEIFRKPFEVALLLGLYIVRIVIPEISSIYDTLIALIGVYAILRIAFDILPANYWRYLIGFSIAFVVFRIYNLFYYQHLFARLTLLFTQLTAIVFTFLFLKGYYSSRKLKRSLFNYFLYAVSTVFMIMLLIATISTIVGVLSLSEFLTEGIVKSAFLVITTFVGFHVSSALVYLLMSTHYLQRSNIIKRQFRFIYEKVYKLLMVLFSLSWIFTTLDYFSVRDPFVEWALGGLRSNIPIGETSFTPMNIIMFVFVIWLSMFISRVIRHILNEEVFTRVKVKKGIPGTVSMLLQVTFVIIGLLLAARAAGMELSNLTIIIGAFSVGIGFGLQNIFNNLVSGLILAFERPIKEGDIVEVNELLGTVRKIGIRSSVVRTFSGAEVIVPNGELISNNLINWTLSDQYRRADIRVGVAYGTDPEIVTSLLMEVALGDQRVLSKPQPQAFFIDFGDSSLDFRLLAWVDQDYRLEVESDLRQIIYKKLNEAEIEIPFPQRDVHLKK